MNLETSGKHSDRRAGIRMLLELARFGHKCLPVSQLRTVNLILKLNRQQPLPVSCRVFGYDLKLEAHRSPVHTMLYLQREDFVEDTTVLAPYLRPGMTVFDIGANIGYLTYFFCRRVAPGGAVFSFEPEPVNYGELAANVERNGITYCHPLQVAVGASNGAVCLTAGLNGHVDVDRESVCNCQMISLDSFVEQHGIPQVDLIKIDVEGWELEVLQGMGGILARQQKPILYVEVHPKGFLGRGDPEKVCSFLQGHYADLVAFRSWDDTRGILSAWQRLEYALSGDAGRPQPASLPELKQGQERFHLLCLPENRRSAGELTSPT